MPLANHDGPLSTADLDRLLTALFGEEIDLKVQEGMLTQILREEIALPAMATVLGRLVGAERLQRFTGWEPGPDTYPRPQGGALGVVVRVDGKPRVVDLVDVRFQDPTADLWALAYRHWRGLPLDHDMERYELEDAPLAPATCVDED